VVEGVSAVRATHPVLYLTHARAFATYRCGVDGGARGRRAAGAAEREGVREAEGDDEDEAMAGDENISMQEAEGGGGDATGGIKKGKRTRSKRPNGGQRQRQAMERADRRLAADEASGS